MAVSQDFARLTALWTNKYRNLTVDGTASTLIVATTTVFAVEIDNSIAATSYFRLYDADAPTVGTTVPRFVIPVPASTKIFFILAEKDGYAFATAVAVASVTTPGTAGATNAEVKASIWTN